MLQRYLRSSLTRSLPYILIGAVVLGLIHTLTKTVQYPNKISQESYESRKIYQVETILSLIAGSTAKNKQEFRTWNISLGHYIGKVTRAESKISGFMGYKNGAGSNGNQKTKSSFLQLLSSTRRKVHSTPKPVFVFSKSRVNHQSNNSTKSSTQVHNPRLLNRNQITPMPTTAKDKTKKLILLYTSLFDSKPWPLVPVDYNFTDLDGSKCPVSSCEVTYNHQKLKESDLVVFHARDLPSVEELRQQRKVNLNQYWSFLMHESPENSYFDAFQLNGLFNLTFTYRGDSDIYVPYHGWNMRSEPVTLRKNFAKGKTKMITFVNSHCDRTRMNFISTLMNYTKVDVYGGCSKLFRQGLPPCPRNSKECDAIQSQYKFYLAFENGFCRDYVTEKYWSNSLQAGLVPIVIGGANYSDSRIAIPRSYINALDFRSLPHLVKYLDYLDRNDTAYNEYHSWRSKYEIRNTNVMCSICAKVRSLSGSKKEVDIGEFWGVSGNCQKKEEGIRHLLNTTEDT